MTCVHEKFEVFVTKPQENIWKKLEKRTGASPSHFGLDPLFENQLRRKQTSSNLSLGKHLTSLSKRFGRKRCCDTTPDQCLVRCHVIILTLYYSQKDD